MYGCKCKERCVHLVTREVFGRSRNRGTEVRTTKGCNFIGRDTRVVGFWGRVGSTGLISQLVRDKEDTKLPQQGSVAWCKGVRGETSRQCTSWYVHSRRKGYLFLVD